MKKRARTLLLFISAIAAALLGFIFIRNLIDFPVYYSAGQSLLAGRVDLYAEDFALGRVMDYRYPPFFLIALMPLCLLPYKAAAYVWYLLSIVQIAVCVKVLRSVESQGTKIVWAVAFFACAQYFVMILHYGNAHLLAMFLMFVSFYMAMRCKILAAALMMSLSITIKLTPVFALPYFALKKQWKFLLLTGVFLLILNIAPAAYFGFGQNAQLLRSWYEKVIPDQEFHEVNGPINLSLKGQLRRYFSEVDYTRRVDGDTRYPAVNVASFGKERTDRAWMAIAAVSYLSGLILILWRSRKNAIGATDKGEETSDSSRAEGRLFDPTALDPLEIGLMICLMLMVGPLTSKIYFIALLWPVVCLARFAFTHSTPAALFGRIALLVVATANFALPLLPGRSIQRLLLVAGIDFYLNSLLLAAIVYALVSHHRESASLFGGSQTEYP